MATKDFKVRHSLTVAENATIEGNLTLGGNTVSRVLDSDEVIGIINNNTSGFDSDQVVAIIGENPGSQTISTSIYTFTSPANDSDFSGTDDNGRILGYTAGKIHVYLNGILLTETVDYTASNGSTVTLVNAPDSDDVLTVVKFLGTVQSGFDSEQVVAIINENVVSGSVDSDVAAVAALRRDADSDSTVIQNHSGRINVLESRADSDETQLQVLNTSINTLRNDLDSESGEISELRRDVDSDIADHDSEIAVINSKINAGPLTDQAVKIGYDAANGHSMSNNNYSILIGSEAGEGISGNNNIGIGRGSAGKSGTGLTGSSNIALGAFAMNESTSGSNNISIGTTSGGQITSGTDNIALGQNALTPGNFNPPVTGSKNIVMGLNAGTGLSSGANNIFIGESTGLKSLSGISVKNTHNIFLGYRAGKILNHTYQTVNGDNNIAIGRNASLPDSEISNTISLGDSEITRLVISGLTLDTADAADGQYLRWNSSTGGFDWVNAISADSDTVAIAALRRDADSDSTRIQAIATEIEALNVLVDSDLKAIADLRNDVDSDSLVIQTLRGDVDTLQNVTNLDSESVARVTDTQFTIVNNGTSAYSFTGDGFPSSSDNPTLYLQRGHTYHFNVNASGHPFEIRLSNGGSAYSTGVTNNAAQVGRVVFTVPMDAPETLVYQCTAHSGMVGTIRIGKQGFDSDQIASMISENAGAGLTDSDLAVVSILRNDLDSETSRIEQLRRDLDSESAVIRQLRVEQDSDSANSGSSGGGAAGFDSDQVVAIISENAASNSIVVTRFDFTATGSLSSTFSGTDDNGKTLQYAVGKIDVYLNGILLKDTDDYTATDGTSVVLQTAPDSDDVLSVKKYFGTENTSQTLNITRFDYTATQGQLAFTGSDNNSNTLQYETGKVQVFLNGILLLQTEDYLDSDGTTITLTSAADSDDQLSIIKYLGSIQTGFDSDQVVAIINENVVSGSVDSDVAAIAQLRRDADSDSLVIQRLRADLDSDSVVIQQLREDLDSEIAVIRQLRAEQDSDSANSGGAGGGAASVDSDYIIARQIVDAKHYNYSGTLATNTGSKRLYMHRDGVLGTFDMHVATAPVGAAINITVKKNGSSIGTGTITSGNTDNNLQTLSTTTFDSGDYLTVDITQIGTTTAGEDLYVVFRIVG